MIEVQALTYDYPGTRALDAVTFRLPAQSITALVGPNGAGKTTLLRCLAALDEPYSGAVQIGSVDVSREPREAHRLIGYLPDHFGLYVDLTVRQCLVYVGRSRGIEESVLQARVQRVIDEVGLADKMTQKAGALSRGQRQRLAIAQAIIHEPRVLLLDEPASGLDPESRASLSTLMRSLAARGMTLCVSSHILAELEQYCTGMLVLQGGRLVEHRQLAHAESARRRIRLRLAQPSAQLADLLGAQAGVLVESCTPQAATISFTGDDVALSNLLRTLLTQDVHVCEVAVDEVSLQDAYLAAVGSHRGASS
jgi:ABC-2 type transport system ATP-binding protein